MSDTPLPAPAERIASILDWLRRALGKHVPRPGKPGLPDALLVLIWSRLASLGRRIARVAAKIDAGIPPGKLRPRRPRPERSTKPPPDPPPPFRLPRGRGWLIRLIGHDAAGGGSQLRHLLAQPDAAPLLADPRMARLLRPLCHMLNVTPPPAIAKPRPAAAATVPGRQPAPSAFTSAAPLSAAPRTTPPPARSTPARRSRAHPTACGPPPRPA